MWHLFCFVFVLFVNEETLENCVKELGPEQAKTYGWAFGPMVQSGSVLFFPSSPLRSPSASFFSLELLCATLRPDLMDSSVMIVPVERHVDCLATLTATPEGDEIDLFDTGKGFPEYLACGTSSLNGDLWDGCITVFEVGKMHGGLPHVHTSAALPCVSGVSCCAWLGRKCLLCACDDGSVFACPFSQGRFGCPKGISFQHGIISDLISCTSSSYATSSLTGIVSLWDAPQLDGEMKFTTVSEEDGENEMDAFCPLWSVKCCRMGSSVHVAHWKSGGSGLDICAVGADGNVSFIDGGHHGAVKRKESLKSAPFMCVCPAGFSDGHVYAVGDEAGCICMLDDRNPDLIVVRERAVQISENGASRFPQHRAIRSIQPANASAASTPLEVIFSGENGVVQKMDLRSLGKKTLQMDELWRHDGVVHAIGVGSNWACSGGLDRKIVFGFLD
jgi:hypothetical protein